MDSPGELAENAFSLGGKNSFSICSLKSDYVFVEAFSAIMIRLGF